MCCFAALLEACSGFVEETPSNGDSCICDGCAGPRPVSPDVTPDQSVEAGASIPMDARADMTSDEELSVDDAKTYDVADGELDAPAGPDVVADQSLDLGRGLDTTEEVPTDSAADTDQESGPSDASSIDVDVPGIVRLPCGVSTIGTCRKGTMVCDLAAGSCGECVGAVYPAAEMCDEQDNDCNGVNDDPFTDKGGPCTEGLGECATAGVRVCSKDGKRTVCGATPGTPANSEICGDGKDNDCNGLVDDGCTGSSFSVPCGYNDVGECRMGMMLCDATTRNCGICTGAIFPSTELCDDKDNDCNGTIDDPFPTKGASCSSGQGECLASGVIVCTADHRGTTCQATPGPATPEVCGDGKDNDCNGVVDEGCGGAPFDVPCGYSNVGQCRLGSMTCTPASRTCTSCSGAIFPQTEVCDGNDNDCNGLVDDTFANKGDSCSAGLGECRREGTMVCTPDGAGTICDAVPGAPHTEICGNGLDDDCDGFADVTIVNGSPVPCACTVSALEAQTTQPNEGPAPGLCGTTQCSLSSSGGACSGSGLSMAFCLNTCPTQLPGGALLYPWTQCQFGTVDFNRFDADNGNAGTIEVSYCLQDRLQGGLSLWYGNWPRRKKLQLLSSAERGQGVAAGCYKKYFRPQSAKCGNFGSSEDPPSTQEMPPECRLQNWLCAEGKWTAAAPTCKFDYDRVPMWLTAEDCVEGTSAATTVYNVTVRWFEDQCACQSNASCASGKVCTTTPYVTFDSAGGEQWSSESICRNE